MTRKNWLILAVVIAILLVLGRWAYNSSKDDSAVVKKTATTESATSAALAAKDCEIDKLNTQLADRDAALAQANKTIALLVENCGGKKTTTYTKQATVETAKKASSKAQGVGGTQTIKKEESEAEYDVNESGYDTKISRVPKSNVNRVVGEIKVCWQFGNRVFYPYIAVEAGEEFPDIVDNKIGGYDLFILPSGTIGSTGKACGIAEDGTHWFRVSEVKKYQDRLEFEAPKPIINGIFMNPTLTEINGQQFFIRK